MGLFGFFKRAMKGFEYKINRETLVAYVEDEIKLSIENQLSFVDEFYIRKNIEDKDEIHITIINYDAPCDSPEDGEENIKGIVIWENNGGYYNITQDERYNDIQSFIECKLTYYPEEFILRNDLCGSNMLEEYKI